MYKLKLLLFPKINGKENDKLVTMETTRKKNSDQFWPCHPALTYQGMFEESICITVFFPPGGHQKFYVTRPGALAIMFFKKIRNP